MNIQENSLNPLICLDLAYSTTPIVTHKIPLIEDRFSTIPDDMGFLPQKPESNFEGGLRTKNYFKQTLPDKPLITVITVVFNGEVYIENTIKSVIDQSYDNMEYIIIDGSSNDATLDIIKRYENKIDYWVSEKDGGIYDAMNKGIISAQGEWVNFLNCGDLFYNSTVIEDIFKTKRHSEIIYGDNLLKYSWGSILLAPDSLSNMTKYMVFGHQTTFVQRSTLLKYGFNCGYKIAADYNLFYLLHKNSHVFEYVPICISIFSAEDGVSSNNPVITFKEDATITGRNRKPLWVVSLFLFRIRILLRSIIILILPTAIVQKLRIINILKNKLIKNVTLNN